MDHRDESALQTLVKELSSILRSAGASHKDLKEIGFQLYQHLCADVDKKNLQDYSDLFRRAGWILCGDNGPLLVVFGGDRGGGDDGDDGDDGDASDFSDFGDASLLVASTKAFGIAARETALHDLLRHGGVIEFTFRLLERLGTLSEDGGEWGDLPDGFAGHAWLEVKYNVWRLVANMCADDDISREFISGNQRWLRLLFVHFVVDYEVLAKSSGGLDPRVFDDELIHGCIDSPSQAIYNLLAYDPARPRCQEAGLVDTLNGVLLAYRKTCSLPIILSDIGGAALPAMIWDLLKESMVDWDVERSPPDLPCNIAVAILDNDDDEFEEALREDIIKFIALHMKVPSGRFTSYAASSPWRVWSLVCLFYNLQGEGYTCLGRDDRPDYRRLWPLEEPAPAKSELAEGLLSAIADVAERDEFPEGQARLLDAEMQNLVNCLSWPAGYAPDEDDDADEGLDYGDSRVNERFIECICMLLGNTARSDAAAMRLVRWFGAGGRVLDVLAGAQQYATRTMATGLLKNLAVPVENRDALGALGSNGNGDGGGRGRVFRLLARGLRESVRGELLHATMAAARVLVTPRNARHMVEDLLPVGAGYESSSGDNVNNSNNDVQRETFFRRLLRIAALVDDQGLKAQAGRYVKRLLQCAYGGECEAQDDRCALEAAIRSVAEDGEVDLAGPLAALVLDRGNAVVRSEGWMALALLARGPAAQATKTEKDKETETDKEKETEAMETETETEKETETMEIGDGGKWPGAARVGELLAQPLVRAAMEAVLAGGEGEGGHTDAEMMVDALESGKDAPVSQALAGTGTENTVPATSEQQGNDRSNVRLLLQVLAERGVAVERAGG